MSKRDRAARAKEAAGTSAADSAQDALDDTTSDAADDASSDEVRPSGKRSGRGRRASAGTLSTDGDADTGSAVAVKDRKKKAPAQETRNPFVRIWVFLQQVVAELKKVIWPTRREMITYTIVVLVFVIIMTAFISGLDLAFAKGVLWLFG
ncbi:preprotein translocase subunit SecE [Gordonia soli]|uniref:Protein translocase subunit SecE n=1 Tax=Gordonia soli NBRC 108243 TaxID=1223545 RepID=M0QKJ2_9ACTN|nr:preprotein translocase subunit SecE [Gordonia soli]GAC67932.1 preprotein translocase SecE subunit [Gordonia soli NBRC 108243]